MPYKRTNTKQRKQRKQTMQIKFKKLHNLAMTPTKNRGDAGWDFYSTVLRHIKPGQRTTIPTGIAIELPYNTVGLIWDRSGLSIKKGLHRVAGVIDATYRGEIIIGVVNLSDKLISIYACDKIAQMIIHRIPSVEFIEADKLTETDRGEKGFGSSDENKGQDEMD